MVSEIDAKLYTNFAFCEEEKKSQLSRKHIDLQSQVIHNDKKNLKKSLYILEDGASGV